MSSPPDLHQFLRFTSQEIPGAVLVNAIAVLSTLGLLTVAFRVIWLALRRYFSSDSDSQSREYVFFNTVLGNYAACLLISNVLSGVAGMMGLGQLAQGGIKEGAYCTAQAILMQISNIGIAYFTVAIGFHTFNSLVLAKRQSVLICALTITTGWTLAAVIAVVPMLNENPEFGPTYGISGLSCNIRPVYNHRLFFYHLLPIFIASIASALLYSISFLVLRGTLVIRGGLKLTLDPNERWAGNVKNYHKFVAGISRSMLWFPIAYVVLLVPYSITRLMDLSDQSCPFPLLVTAYVFWFLLGVANVITLYNTFRVLGPAISKGSGGEKDAESSASRSGSHILPPMIAIGEADYTLRPSMTSSMSEKVSRPNSIDSFIQVQPAPSEDSARPFQLQPPPLLSARIQPRREEIFDQVPRSHSRNSSYSRTHSRNGSDMSATTPSFYSYGTTLSVDAPSRPKARASKLYNEPLTPNRLPRSTPPPMMPPNQGLPAPPRPSKRPTRRQEPSTPQLASSGYMPNGLISAVGSDYQVPPIPTDVQPNASEIFRSQSVQSYNVLRSEANRPRGNSEPKRA